MSKVIKTLVLSSYEKNGNGKFVAPCPKCRAAKISEEKLKDSFPVTLIYVNIAYFFFSHCL